MGDMFGNWFSFTSKEQRERKEKAARRKAYPLGEEQEKWEDETIKELFKDDKKADLKMIKYAAISLREMEANSKLDESDDSFCELEKALTRFKDTLDSLGITEEQMVKIKALNEVMTKAGKIEDLKL